MDLTVSLKGKTALVTGASGGLGEHFALTLAASGAQVAVAARRSSDCERVCARIRAKSGIARPVALDVTDPASAESAVQQVGKEFGSLDILVNNAGIAATQNWFDTTEADFDRIMDTNVKGVFLMAQAAAKAMKVGGKEGVIVNIASILSFAVLGQVGSYATSKAAVVQMTRAMALEWARFGIRVNALCPGYIETEINRTFFESDAGKAIIKRIPQRRLGTKSDLDGPLLLLCSDAGRYITGASLVADGGHLLSQL